MPPEAAELKARADELHRQDGARPFAWAELLYTIAEKRLYRHFRDADLVPYRAYTAMARDHWGVSPKSAENYVRVWRVLIHTGRLALGEAARLGIRRCLEIIRLADEDLTDARLGEILAVARAGKVADLKRRMDEILTELGSPPARRERLSLPLPAEAEGTAADALALAERETGSADRAVNLGYALAEFRVLRRKGESSIDEHIAAIERLPGHCVVVVHEDDLGCVVVRGREHLARWGVVIGGDGDAQRDHDDDGDPDDRGPGGAPGQPDADDEADAEPETDPQPQVDDAGALPAEPAAEAPAGASTPAPDTSGWTPAWTAAAYPLDWVPGIAEIREPRVIAGPVVLEPRHREFLRVVTTRGGASVCPTVMFDPAVPMLLAMTDDALAVEPLRRRARSGAVSRGAAALRCASGTTLPVPRQILATMSRRPTGAAPIELVFLEDADGRRYAARREQGPDAVSACVDLPPTWRQWLRLDYAAAVRDLTWCDIRCAAQIDLRILRNFTKAIGAAKGARLLHLPEGQLVLVPASATTGCDHRGRPLRLDGVGFAVLQPAADGEPADTSRASA